MPTEPNETRTPYDELAYNGTCYPASCLDNLAVVASLAGLSHTPVESCHVLELGCASGLNLIPMAAMFPQSTFLGIDLSARQVCNANELILKAGLQNIRVAQQDILNFDHDVPFDYILAHGIYSWVPQSVRDRMLSICRHHLAGNGLAYLSFNALPGFRVKQITRDMMLYHSRGAKTIPEAVSKAREIISLASAALPKMDTPYLRALRELAPDLLSRPDWYLAHDDLEAVCEPVYLQQFFRHIQKFQLAYVGGAEPLMNLVRVMPPALRDQLRTYSNSIFELEQYGDFIYGTQYRAAVLSLQRSAPSRPMGSHAVKAMFCAASLVEAADPHDPLRFGEIRFLNEATKGDVITSEPVFIAVLRHLTKCWPHAVAFDELYSVAAANASGGDVPVDFLAQNLFACYCRSVLELWTRPTTFLAGDLAKPHLTKLARIQAGSSESICSLRHTDFRPITPFMRRMLPLMDGSRDREALELELNGFLARKELSLQTVDGPVVSPEAARSYFSNALKVLNAGSMFSAQV